MAQLATCCPHCQTRFRVSMAQLELRGGKVRCGACREIFNGVETVFEYEESLTDERIALSPSAPRDSSDRMTLLDLGTADGSSPGGPAAPSTSNMQEELDALSRAIADLQSKPWTEPPATPQAELSATDDHDDHSETRAYEGTGADSTTAADDAPAFVQQARRRQRRSRAWIVLLWIAIPLLVLTLAAQLVYHFRHEIAARSPQAAPYLHAACAQLGCTIRLPMQIDQLSLPASRLDAVSEASGQFILVALLRNHGNSVQTWPSLDLKLKNADGELIVRRAFLSRQYATPDDIRAGMPAQSEREIRLPLQLEGEPPASFEITIFHH